MKLDNTHTEDTQANRIKELAQIALETLSTGIWEKDLSSGKETWTPDLSKILGYSGKNQISSIDYLLDHLVHPAEQEQLRQLIGSIEDEGEGEDVQMQIRLKQKDGLYRWFEFTGRLLVMESGVKSILGLFRDNKNNPSYGSVNTDNSGQDIHEQVSMLNQTQEFAKIGSWHLNLDTMDVIWSDQLYQIHEVPLGTPIKVDKAIEYYREDFRDIISNAVQKCIEEAIEYELECVIYTETGKEKWIKTIGSPILKNGKVTGLQGLFMDIHNEKILEIDKDKLSFKFESIFNSTYNFIGLIDTSGTFIDINQAALDFSGLEHADVIGTKVYDAPWWRLSEKNRPKLIQSIEEASKGHFVRYDVDVIGDNNKKIRMDFSLSPIKDQSGEVKFIIPEGRNITDRIALKEKVTLGEKQLRQFVEIAPVAVAMLDLNMNYIVVSNAWYKEYELSVKDLTGKNHYDIFPEIKNMPEWLDIHEKALKGEQFSKENDEFTRSDGSVNYINWKIFPWYEEPGTPGGIMMYTLDVTEQVKYQSKLENLNEVLEKRVKQRTQELDKAVKELESFSYSISHDLRAPLRSINGFADILLSDYSDDLKGDANRYLNIIRDNGLKMGDLIDDILAFSRLGRKALAKHPVDMNQLAASVSEDVKEYYKELEAHVRIDKLGSVYGDQTLLRQVLFNLLSNAFKYSSKNAKIEIQISCTINEGEVKFCVTDNGVGFDMRYHKKLFGVFQRLHSDEEFEGTGVGLAIVRRIVEKHEGRVWAESEPGKGSTFYFTLPTKKSKNE